MIHRAGKKAGAPEMGETLCCCEYLDRKGQRSHLAACLCECEDLDEGCERWMTCKSLPPGILERIADTFMDRFRLPWIRGAVKIDISLLPPVILLPFFLHIAALHFLLAVVILILLPMLVLWYYYLTHRKKEHFPLSLGGLTTVLGNRIIKLLSLPSPFFWSLQYMGFLWLWIPSVKEKPPSRLCSTVQVSMENTALEHQL